MAEVTRELIDSGTATFSSNSQLLSELGERLIATNQIALSELVKNAYDADAVSCHIWLEDDNSELIVEDDGHGMTEDEFLNFWMTIATPNRTRNPESRRYDRPVTGSKGVGRFAVRNLGRHLELTTVAYYPEHDEHRRLTAEFDWVRFERVEGLGEMDVDYEIEAATEAEEGTRLQISKLQEDWSQEKLEEVADEVLDIASPPYMTAGTNIREETEGDPGFSVFFAPPGEESTQTSAVHEIYERYVARVEITIDEGEVTFDYEYTHGYDEPHTRSYTFELDELLIESLSGEIRYLPQRKGVFKMMETIDGRTVSSWLRDNGGVRIIDNGFRVPPYGDEGNDWLNLSESAARRERDWRSPFTSEYLPAESLTSGEIRERQLNIPRKNQVLGAIHVSTHPGQETDSETQTDRLMSDMNRQGLVENDAMEQLRDITRGALEILAVIDIEEQKKKKERKVKNRKEDVQKSIEVAKKNVKERVDVTPDATNEILKEYEEIQEEVEEYEQANEERNAAVESMHLLGVITGFMSHETDEMLQSAERMLEKWREVPEEERTPEFEDRLETTENAVDDLQNHLGYAKRFVGALEDGSESSFSVAPRVDEVIGQLESYTEPRHITAKNTVPEDLESPEVNISLYSGILLNLYSNAVKAVMPISTARRERKVRFDADNTDGQHTIRVSDTGVGIPDGVEDRIFDPLFSTTDLEEDSPLGGGTGMGLYIIDQVLESIDGNIEVTEPPEGYETCFKVTIPYE